MTIHASARVALVIGNGAYTNLPPLRNPVNDAEDIAAMLETKDFDVTLRINQSHRQMLDEIARFDAKLRQGEVGLFYFAGHGVQVNGVNYLIPVGANIKRDYLIPAEAVSANSVLGAMESAANELNIVILDACRNNPFPKTFRSVSRGLAKLDAPTGSIVAYATAPGSVAADGDGRNGVYTKHLLKAMNTPGLKVEEVFKRVRIGVEEETKGDQTPWEESSLKGDFYFTTETKVTVTPGKPEGSTVAVDKEMVYWNAVEDSSDPQLFQSYLDQYPNGTFAGLARIKIERLTETEKSPTRIAGGTDVETLLLECQAHLQANRLTTGKGGNAADCYEQVLQQSPGNQDALNGLAAIEQKYQQWAESALKRFRMGLATRYLNQLRKFRQRQTARASR